MITIGFGAPPSAAAVAPPRAQDSDNRILRSSTGAKRDGFQTPRDRTWRLRI